MTLIKTSQVVEDWLQSHKRADKIYSESLLRELIDFGEKKSMEYKVLRIYGLCLRQKHFELAARICKKYNRFFMGAGKSDIAIAFGWALMANKQQSNG